MYMRIVRNIIQADWLIDLCTHFLNLRVLVLFSSIFVINVFQPLTIIYLDHTDIGGMRGMEVKRYHKILSNTQATNLLLIETLSLFTRR